MLGALMLGGALGETSLTASDFYRTAHSHVFDAIEALRSAGEPVDAVSVAATLQTRGTLADVGGRVTLLDLADAAPVSSHAHKYAEIVRDKSRLRGVIQATTAAEAAAYEGHDADEVIAGHTAAMLTLSRTGSRPCIRASAAVARRLEDYARPSSAARLPGTGTRLHFGDVCVIGGRSGVGKTALALQAVDVWRDTRRVLFMSFEMSIAELADRLIARATGRGVEIAHAGLTDHERDGYRRESARLLEDERLELVEAAGMSEAQTIASIRAFAAAGGRIAVLDYIQIAYEVRTNENADLARFMRSIQQVAKQSGVLILALSQFSRAPEDGQPRLHHLRGSGALEQEAATVGLMWAPEPDDAEKRKQELRRRGYMLDVRDPRPLIRLDWRKVRHGRTAMDYFLLDGAAMRLEPISKAP
ncbi:MAG TPA: hypothetical protein ENN80_11830 [Candidatus Hydrogenedentes bacterium]|nr:hypothetical protein [Candidatus Hydrogenedentota bacterium]